MVDYLYAAGYLKAPKVPIVLEEWEQDAEYFSIKEFAAFEGQFLDGSTRGKPTKELFKVFFSNCTRNVRKSQFPQMCISANTPSISIPVIVVR
mmetsp:Transcript_26271/g.56409  ORF Transcript_26271/g.56409 Transcript_26271/m.56409 type:complete len:93 (-) Transcript_26271:97-375(-)